MAINLVDWLAQNYYLSTLNEVGDHDNDVSVLLPHHLPEIRECGG